MRPFIPALLLVLNAPAALADEASCKQCCAAVGAGGCSATLRIVGEDSLIIDRGVIGYEVVGLWVSSCDGKAWFDIDQSAIFAEEPVVGEVATDGVPGAALRCFTEACSFPANVCPQAIGTRPVLRRCDGAQVTDAMLAVPGPKPPSGAGATTVVIDGRPVVVVTAKAASPPPASPAPGYGQSATAYNQPAPSYGQSAAGYSQPTASATPPATGYGQPATTYNQPAPSYGQSTTGYSQPATGYNQPATGYNQPATGYNQPATGYNQPAAGYNQPAAGYNQPATGYSQPAPGYSQPTTTYSQPAAAYAPPAAPQPAAPVNVAAPKAPPATCTTGDALIKESRKHVEMGNDSELTGDLAKAADEYRAAITLYPCNGFAWSALGSLALRANQPAEAAKALEIARKLQPNHYGAATDLGKAYEALGKTTEAIAAYQAALKANPGYAPASQALARLGASPR